METFNSSVDHRLAEIIMNKLYERVSASVWKYGASSCPECQRHDV
ncbi:hypothetical protein FQF38_24790 [Escherichia coli]|nr:hypothetical protein [Escherichia coli]